MNLRPPSTSPPEASLNRSAEHCSAREDASTTAEQCSALRRGSTATQRGVALVITLILLAVITTLAIAFLGLTRRETQAVDSMARTTDAEMAADSALERAKAQIIAGYPVRNKDYFNASPTFGPDIMGPEMFVSICCQNSDVEPATFKRTSALYNRFNPIQRFDPTNNYDAGPPVFVRTASGGVDDRFYVDLNRNDYFDESGYVTNTTNIKPPGGQYEIDFATTGNAVTNWRIGDPHWIGVLQNPRAVHSPSNHYIARHAFMVLPAGRSLDANWIHNDVNSDLAPGIGQSWYSRNQGVGGYEINLAAFLTDLNANEWNGYQYLVPQGFPNVGVSFSDAYDLLKYRYMGNKALGGLPQLRGLDELLGLGLIQRQPLENDNIDSYAHGPFELTGSGLVGDNDFTGPTKAWPGGANRTNFFSVNDFLNTNLTKLTNFSAFVFRLQTAASRGNVYDRYTFYRMLSQLGTDSVPDEDEGKIDINYVNVAGIKAVELIPWTDTVVVSNRTGRIGPELFFLSVVTNILAREFPDVRMANGEPGQPPLRIPVYTNGSRFWVSNNVNYGPLYSGRIHQILQQAANIYDATRAPQAAEFFPGYAKPIQYPTVFRPRFKVDINNPGDVHIVDFVVVPETSAAALDIMFSNDPKRRWVDLDVGGKTEIRSEPSTGISDNGIYNIPLIIGARWGYPNFNEFATRTHVQAVRRLDVHKNPGVTNIQDARVVETSTIKVFADSGMEAWNSYLKAYPRQLSFMYSNEVTVGITSARASVSNRYNTVLRGTNSLVAIQAGKWPGYSGIAGTSTGFSNAPVSRFFVFTNIFTQLVGPGGDEERWDVYVTNRMRFFLVDNNTRIVDAVALSLTDYFNVGEEMVKTMSSGSSLALQNIWSRARSGGSTGSQWRSGVANQLQISMSKNQTTPTEWTDYSGSVKSRNEAIDAFIDFLTLNTNITVSNQVPFTATREMHRINRWQVNDPLVHQHIEDLQVRSDGDKTPEWQGSAWKVTENAFAKFNVGEINTKVYQPWPQDPIFQSPGSANANPSLRDPSIQFSDSWNFPTNKFPTIGWLGRVHRGTPWQTVYFKSRVAPLDPPPGSKISWRNVGGQFRSKTHLLQTHPTNDWRLADVFTTSIHPNVTRGRLSINQTHLAAWSAVLSGVATRSVSVDPRIDPDTGDKPVYSTNEWISPASVSPASEVSTIVNSINATRNVHPYHQFTRLSEILAVPGLTDRSPFISNPGLTALGFNSSQPPDWMNATDSDYERIPQQILSLLKVGEPRFVIYSWGQSLKPARQGVDISGATPVLGGPSIDPGTKTVNNYQVTGEAATRTVVRVVFPEKLDAPVAGPGHPFYGTPDYRKPRVVVESFNVIPLE